MTDYEATYEEFWKELVEVDGQINLDQVKRELHDYRVTMTEVALVYDALTEGMFSKPNTYHQYVIDRVNELHEAESMEQVAELQEALKVIQGWANDPPALSDGKNCVPSAWIHDWVNKHLAPLKEGR